MMSTVKQKKYEFSGFRPGNTKEYIHIRLYIHRRVLYFVEVVRKADKAIGRHTKKQNKLCEYSYSLQAEIYREFSMTNQIKAFIRFHSFSAFCPIITSFCLIACLPNAGPPYFNVVRYEVSIQIRILNRLTV